MYAHAKAHPRAQHPEPSSQRAVKEADVIRVTRLSGPTAREAEEMAAEYVEEEVARYDGRNLGVRTPRDGRDGSGL